MTKLKNSDLIEDGIFDKFQKDAKLAEASLRLLETAILDTQKASASLAESTPLEGYKNIQLRVKAVEDYEDAEKSLAKVQAEREKLAQKIADQEAKAEQKRANDAAKETARQAKAEATRAKMAAKEAERQSKAKKAVKDMSDAEIKAETIQKKQDADRIKRLKAEAVLLDDQAGALEKLAAKNRLLAQERESMPDISTPEAKARITEINAEINANNELIAENSDKLKQQKMNVGNYTDSILEALGASKEFGGGVAGVTNAFDSLSPALNVINKGLQKFTMWNEKAEQQSKDTNIELSKTKKIMAGVAIGATALAGAALGGLATAFNNSRAGGEQMDIMGQKMSASMGILANKLLSATGLAKDFGNEADKAVRKQRELESELASIQELQSDPMQKRSEKVEAAAKATEQAIIDVKNQIIELDKQGIKPLTESSAGLFEQLNDIWTDQSINEYIKAMNMLRVETGAYSIELAKLTGLAEANDAIEGNNTRSLNDRIEAMRRASKYTIEAAKVQEKLNQKNLEIANQALFIKDKINLGGLFEQYGINAENAKTKISELYTTNKKFADELDSTANIEQINAMQNAMATLVTAQYQLKTKLEQLQAKEDMAVQDQAEMDLDMLQDTYGKKLTLIEAEIAKTRVTTAEKIMLQRQATDELEKTSKRTREVLTQQGLAGSKNPEAILKLFDITDLDTLNKAIRQLEKSEMIEKRVQQYVEDYKEYLVQVADLKKQIADEDERISKLSAERYATNQVIEQIRQARKAGGTVEEINKKISEIEKQAATDAFDAKRDEINQRIYLIDKEEKQKREKLATEIQEIEAEIAKKGGDKLLESVLKFKNEKLNALNGESEDRATALKELADVELEIEKNKTAAYIEEQQKREDESKKALEAEKESIKQRNEMAQAAASFMENLLKQQAQRRIDAVDKQISATDKQISALEETARAGVESSTENLAYETKKRAELEAEREKEIKRMKRMELALALIKVYLAKVAAGEKNPLASTAIEMVGMQALVESIPTFFEGTNEKTVGEVLGKPDIAGRDGYIVRVDRDETILNAENTRQYHASLKEPDAQPVENTAVLRKLDGIADAIASKPVYTGLDYNHIERAVITTVETRHKIMKTHRKGGVFGN